MVNAPVEVPPVLDAVVAGCEEEGAADTVTVPPWSVIFILPMFTPPTVNPTGAVVSKLVPVVPAVPAPVVPVVPAPVVPVVPAPVAPVVPAPVVPVVPAPVVPVVPAPVVPVEDAAGLVLTVINPPLKLVWPTPPVAPAEEEVLVVGVVVVCCGVVCMVFVVVVVVVVVVATTKEPEFVLVVAGLMVSVPLAKVIV